MDLDIYARDAVRDDMPSTLDELCDHAMDATHDEAASACIYHHNCAEIIRLYEDRCSPEDLSSGATFTAENWAKAMEAWAYNVARAYIDQKVGELLAEIKQAAAELQTYCGFDHEPTIHADCPFAWAPQTQIDGNIHHWFAEATHVRGIEAGGIWLIYTWT